MAEFKTTRGHVYYQPGACVLTHPPARSHSNPGVPCAHTRTVGFETTKAQYDKMQQVRTCVLSGACVVGVGQYGKLQQVRTCA